MKHFWLGSERNKHLELLDYSVSFAARRHPFSGSVPGIKRGLWVLLAPSSGDGRHVPVPSELCTVGRNPECFTVIGHESTRDSARVFPRYRGEIGWRHFGATIKRLRGSQKRLPSGLAFLKEPEECDPFSGGMTTLLFFPRHACGS